MILRVRIGVSRAIAPVLAEAASSFVDFVAAKAWETVGFKAGWTQVLVSKNIGMFIFVVGYLDLSCQWL